MSDTEIIVQNPPAIEIIDEGDNIEVLVEQARYVEIVVTGGRGQKGDDGSSGQDGREVELQSTSEYLQWRYVGETGWTNLISISELISVVTKPAGQTLSAQRIVIMDSDGKLYYGDKDTVSTAKKTLGLTLHSGNLDEDIRVLLSGRISDPSFSFTLGMSIYLGNNGLLTQIYPTSGYVLKLGIPVDANTFILKIDIPIILG